MPAAVRSSSVTPSSPSRRLICRCHNVTLYGCGFLIVHGLIDQSRTVAAVAMPATETRFAGIRSFHGARRPVQSHGPPVCRRWPLSVAAISPGEEGRGGGLRDPLRAWRRGYARILLQANPGWVPGRWRRRPGPRRRSRHVDRPLARASCQPALCGTGSSEKLGAGRVSPSRMRRARSLSMSPTHEAIVTVATQLPR